MASLGNIRYAAAAFFAAMLMALGFTLPAHAEASAAASPSGLGIIKGVVRDEAGDPIAGATVAIFKLGTSTLLKQVNSAANGSFLTRIAAGRYTVLAVAEGFNPESLREVTVNRSAELNFGFNLVRAGAGNTLPEKRVDRNSSKWRVRAAQVQRAIYQNQQGRLPIDTAAPNDEQTAAEQDDADDDEGTGRKPGVRSVVETNFTTGRHGAFPTVNFASVIPLAKRTEVVFLAQTSPSTLSSQRFETVVNFRPNDAHRIRISAAATKLGRTPHSSIEKTLGQASIQALDEWRVREGLVLVYGVDYSKFLGAGSDASLSPRLGLQFDIDPRTRFTAAYASPTEQPTWSQVIESESGGAQFREPLFVEDLAVVNSKPQMNKSRRLEFGIERVLDNSSSIETGVFYDTTAGRGVGLTNLPFDVMGGDEFGEFVAEQHGKARGVRVVYNRRISGVFSAGAGYSFGEGQMLAVDSEDPANVFDRSLFQSFFAKLSADMDSGTSVQTVFRLSPKATVFAIDPFMGRLAIYDPGLSVLVTQRLPNFGLPFRAQAMVDARNVLGFSSGVSSEEGTLRLASSGRVLRGGILVRF
ncbi:MAG: TonB-dependent receptor [Acidobacteria bacterium]|nr:TonB-dependent receptor [Acidobacteriota bacterium]